MTDGDPIVVRRRWLWYTNPAGCWWLEFTARAAYEVIGGD